MKFISNNNLMIIILNDTNNYLISNLFNLFMFFGLLKIFEVIVWKFDEFYVINEKRRNLY